MLHPRRLARWRSVYILLIIYSVSNGGMVKNGNELFSRILINVFAYNL
jgi:hypothetical protein